MAKTTARAALVLSPEEQQRLQSLAASRSAPLREVQRAKLLLGYHARQGFSTQKFRMVVPTVIGEAPALEKLGRQVLWCRSRVPRPFHQYTLFP
jgi:hypothetical protein